VRAGEGREGADPAPRRFVVRKNRGVPDAGRDRKPMSEQELLDLARSATVNEVAWFGQIITINFAMVVGIYYFLNRAQMALKLFAFGAYLVGMFLIFGEILLESNLKLIAMHSLAAFPHPSDVIQGYLGLHESWLAILTAALFNGAYWLLAAGVFYLIFFWKERAPGPD
jgi:hypothetical protein